MGVLSGEEKWRPDRIGITEAREIRRGRREGPSRRSRRGAEGDCPAHSAWEPAELPGRSPALQDPPTRSSIGPGGIGGRPRGEQERQVGGAGEETRAFALPT